MTTVGAFDAKTHLNALLKRVSKGEVIRITHVECRLRNWFPLVSRRGKIQGTGFAAFVRFEKV
jgi:hypothetical protein